MEKITRIIFVAISIVFVTISGAKVASAASLYFSPSSGSYNIGQSFSVNIYVSSVDQAMNAASGVISFDKSKLEIISLSKSGSIFSLWVQEPSFSNSVGVVNFEGIVLNPGFIGSAGKVVTINFKAKTVGSVLLNFSNGSVLANDGKGTDILTDLSSVSFDLANKQTSSPPVKTRDIFSAPEIFSLTHPDREKWYSDSNPKFKWNLSSDVKAVRILYDRLSDSQPTVVYSPPISERELKEIKDGIWYFHVQFKNNQNWGPVSHFRFQIDTEPPESFSIKFIDGRETENIRPVILFDTVDSLSGISYYKVKIGEGDLFKVESEAVKENPHTLPPQSPGKRSVLIQAFDKAGNFTFAKEEFTIKPPQIAPVSSGFASGFFKKIVDLSAKNYLILIIVVLLLVILYFWRRFRFLKKHLAEETTKAKHSLHKSFDKIYESFRNQIDILIRIKSKKEIGIAEDKVVKEIKGEIEAAEKLVEREIDDIKEK